MEVGIGVSGLEVGWRRGDMVSKGGRGGCHGGRGGKEKQGEDMWGRREVEMVVGCKEGRRGERSDSVMADRSNSCYKHTGKFSSKHAFCKQLKAWLHTTTEVKIRLSHLD